MVPALSPTVPLISFSFYNGDVGLPEQVAKAQAELPSLSKMPAAEDRLFSEKLGNDWRAFMTTRMIWRIGTWQGILSRSVAGHPDERAFHFEKC